MNCLRCNTAMEYLGSEELQLGRYGFFLGHLSNLLSGSIEVKIYSCPSCGKLEFFNAEQDREESLSERIKKNLEDN